MKNNKEFETFFTFIFVIMFIVVAVVAVKEWSSAPYTGYIKANDGGYLPVTYYPCEVMEISGRELTVEHDGNEYTCYATETDLEIGEIAWCGFASYEGNVEFIDIK